MSTRSENRVQSKVQTDQPKTSKKISKNEDDNVSVDRTNHDLLKQLRVEPMKIATLTKADYADVDGWDTYYDNGKDLKDMQYHLSWHVMFAHLFKHPKFEKINNALKELVRKNRKIKLYPLPSHITSAFQLTRASDLKVVFIGQDPYFNHEIYGDTYVPQAMGLSFSVPTGVKIPSSLNNIYDNMIKYGHLKQTPKSGNLWFWAAQGCLMLNAALTVIDDTKEAHLKMWEWFTDYVIQYISQHMEGVIFVLWGGYAYKKISMIDLDRHHTIISSHPSGLSAHKPLQNYPAFVNEDHFGKINQILEKAGKTKIIWG
ncbi:uracil-DNA glycosylase-like [Yasminevirus sp. GU-2018]|uniref:Uracil-DNA glycosylase-like n=1 Tax=Yasminevirus sp. GU-2018 TaxID=2420051 RepID=A0A5K0U8Y6_9VIRU|nr:uracil-DNA glycosylase-like [Yasminevirus sp. GU-2018]